VLLGPFAGVSYFNEVVWGPIEPKWIGCYEAELHPIFESMRPDEYDVIVDVGSAEGYYSVSLAKKFEKAEVISYDTDPWAREQQARLAKLNDCKNISIRRLCTPRRLERDIRHSKRSLVICDMEGFEYELLRPLEVPSLVNADILNEIHFTLDERKLSVDDGCQELIERFSASHLPKIISVMDRDLDLINSKLPMGFSNKSDLAEAVDEHRPSFQKWLWLTAKLS
jgi:23S rRNA U2552 (ribose-2'-O)-methylase RlmE/FtsJ